MVISHLRIASATPYSNTLDSATELTVVNTNRTALYDCANYGNIKTENFATKVSSNKHVRTLVGGCFGTHSTIFDLENVHNYGEVDVTIKATSNVFASGMIGYWGSPSVKEFTAYIKNCSNTKDVTITSVLDNDYKGTSSTEGHLVAGIIGQSYMNNAGNAQTHIIENVTNSGNITLKGDIFNDGSLHAVGGISAYLYTYATFINCSNSGTIKMEPTAGKTIKTAYIGGFIGEFACKNSNVSENPTTVTNCTNTGAVIAKSFNSTSALYIGGFVGYQKNQGGCVYTFDGCKNSAEVKIDNVTASGNLYTGGLFGYFETATSNLKGTNINVGNINFNGGSLSASKTFVGGVIGNTKAPIAGAHAYCNITALGATQTGMIMGTAYAEATAATNCKVGGRILWESKYIADEETGENTLVETPGDLTSDNWFKHIYSNAVEKSDAEGAGCGLLSAQPTVQ